MVPGDTSAVQDKLYAHAGPTFRAVISGWADLGVIKYLPEDPRIVPSQKFELPHVAAVAELGATNFATNTAVDPVQGPSSKRSRGPVIGRALMSSTTNAPYCWRADALRSMLLTQPEYFDMVGESMGKRAMQAIKVAFYNACIGAVGAMTSTVRHQKTSTSAAVYTDVIDAQKTLWNRRNDLVLGIFHPNQIASIPHFIGAITSCSSESPTTTTSSGAAPSRARTTRQNSGSSFFLPISQ